MPAVLLTWPQRRFRAMVLLVPLLGTALVLASGADLGAVTPAWIAFTVTAATTGGAVLASYLPATGRKLEIGCSPCATMAALSVVGELMAMHTYGSLWIGPALAIAVSLFGLTQRLGDSTTCAVPVGTSAPTGQDEPTGPTLR